MKYRSALMVFMMLFFCSSLVFGAGSFFESANQAEEAGKAVKQQDVPPVDDAAVAEEEEEHGNSQIDKDREKDSPADHDNGKGNDDKVAKGDQKDSPADHDNGKGNDDKVAKGDQKDSPADHDNGKGNDDKGAKDKKVVDPSKPCDNDEFDPTGKFNPGKIDGCSDKELIKIIDKTWNIKVTGWQYGHSLMNPGFIWSYSHLFEIYRSLYVLPRIFFLGNLNLCWSRCIPSCSSFCHLQGNSIFFCNFAPLQQGWLSSLFMREMGRFLFLSKEFSYLRAQWIKMFWLDEKIIKIKPPFDFICKTPDEDFGESFKCYWSRGEWFKSCDKARYEFIYRLVMKGKSFSWRNGGNGFDMRDVGKASEPKKPVATATKQIGNGDHGASGKADLNDKNKIDNASKANNAASQAAKSTAAAKNSSSGKADYGASGKTDQNDKNKAGNAATANNSSAKTTGSTKK